MQRSARISLSSRRLSSLSLSLSLSLSATRNSFSWLFELSLLPSPSVFLSFPLAPLLSLAPATAQTSCRACPRTRHSTNFSQSLPRELLPPGPSSANESAVGCMRAGWGRPCLNVGVVGKGCCLCNTLGEAPEKRKSHVPRACTRARRVAGVRPKPLGSGPRVRPGKLGFLNSSPSTFGLHEAKPVCCCDINTSDLRRPAPTPSPHPTHRRVPNTPTEQAPEAHPGVSEFKPRHLWPTRSQAGLLL